ncbi:MAG: glutamine--fructose-6-phosphate transaminase (isomerizing) [Planctomycetota bacterium]|nr:MAG: glutamine--fructose-6-phosphate transaminase (isomerizing) [Planctomycetota bacterium]
MCGIFGIIGKKNCVQDLLKGISKLEYRGYDSAGLSIPSTKEMITIKNKGKVSGLQEKVESFNLFKDDAYSTGIIHTRWATHGVPSEANSHPHNGNQNIISVVHNGIIENYRSLKSSLISEGYSFNSETDSEVLAVLIEKFYEKGQLLKAVNKALKEVDGAYAIAVVSNEDINQLVVARKKSPLVIGKGKDRIFIASDPLPIIEYTKDIFYMKDGYVASIIGDQVKVYDENENPIEIKYEHCSMSPQSIAKDGYDHFMLKEIYEQPEAIESAIAGRVFKDQTEITLEDDILNKDLVNRINRIVIIGCGTAWHAGLIGRNIFERFTKLPVQVDYASDFRYRDPIIDENTLVIAISQSGETADTLGALALANENKTPTLAIVNAVGSTMTREANEVIYTRAGPEIGVASTKAFSAQVLVLYLVAMHIGTIRGILDVDERKRRIKNILKLPSSIRETFKKCSNIKKIASIFKDATNTLFLGRGTGYPVALEGALKLKEISYIHAEGYHAAELKHGPLALVDENMPVVVLALKGRRYSKIINNIEEVKARGGKIIAIVSEGDKEMKNITSDIIEVSEDVGILNSILVAIPMQLLSYYVAVVRGCDVDQPRNLAKSVTVE